MSDDVALDLLDALNRINNQLKKQNEELEKIEIAIKRQYGG